MRKMEFAGSTGTLKQAPQAILQSCSTFPSVQVTTPAPPDSCEHIPTSVQGRKRGKEAPPAAPHIWIVSVKEKNVFLQFNVPNSGHSTKQFVRVRGSGDAPGSVDQDNLSSHTSLSPFPTSGTHSTAWCDCKVWRHRKGKNQQWALGRWD